MSLNENTPICKRNTAVAKFWLFSIIGIIVFFVSCIPQGNFKVTPLVFLIDFLKNLLSAPLIGEHTILQCVLLFFMVGIALTTVCSVFIKNNNFINHFHGEDSVFSKILYIMGGVFSISFFFMIGPDWWLDPDVGLLAWSLGGNVLITVALSGSLIAFIAEYGLLEVIGTFMEPLMRPIYNVPGYAAVDGVASFVCAPAVGVYFTNKLYVNKGYTKREAAAVTTNFSVCSLGFFMLLVELGGIQQYYTKLVLASFFVVFVMAIITIRIPPISRVPNEFIDGTVRTEIEKVSYKGVFMRAFHAAVDRAQNTSGILVWNGIKDACTFGIKIASYVVGIAAIACAISAYTPLFDWLGKPFIPVLQFLGVPNAVEISPAMLVGITEIAMPVLVTPVKEIATEAVFFVLLLSTVQIIFFTESGNAMLESKIPLNFIDICLVFLVRTIVALPLCALACHVIF